MSRAIDASRGRAIEAHRIKAILALVRIAGAVGLVGLVLGAALAWTASRAEDRQLTQLWLRQQVSQHLKPGFQARQQAGIVDSPAHVAATALLTRMAIAGGIMAVLLSGTLTTLQRRQWIKTAQAVALDQVLRGSRVATASELAALVKLDKQARPIRLGGVAIPPQDEARHLLMAGRSGSGKTTALRSLVHQVGQRGEHALIFDADGSYVAHFYQPARGDIILNPWDARSARWNPLADVVDLADAYRVAFVLLPKPSSISEGAVWYDQARTVLAHIIHHLVQNGRTRLDGLLAMLARASVDDLRAILAGTPAARAFEPGAEKATASVLFMLTTPTRIVAMLAAVPDAAPAFSFDAFYAGLDDHPGPKPFVFLAAPRRYREAASPIVVAWIDAAASAILRRDIDSAPKAWLILDELASLPPIQSLLTLLPEGRKYRACVTIAFQTIAQLQQSYGEHGAQIVTGQTATQLLMAAGDHATARWGVDLIGSVEVENARSTETLGSDQDGRGSLATNRERKTLVIDAELTGLAVGEAFLRLSGYPLAKITIDPPGAMPVIAPDFVAAPVAPAPGVAIPTPAPTARIEDRDDWLTAGPF